MSPEHLLRQLADAVRGIRFGSVEVVIHDGEIVQIERREKVAPPPPGQPRALSTFSPTVGPDLRTRQPLRRSSLMRPTYLIGLALAPALFVALAARPTAAQQDSTRALLERLEELEQRVKVLARLREIENDSAVQVNRARPNVNTSGDGFFFRSPDGQWRLRVGGYFQADTRIYPADDANLLVTGFLIRRARPLIEGTVARYFDFRIMPDFGSGQPTIFEAWLEARLDPAVAIRAGKFKPPIGLERLQSATDLRFIERGFPTNLAPNRDVGVQLSGDLAGGTVRYEAGLFNGVPDLGFGDVDANDSKELAGRIFVVPFARQGRTAPVELGLGVAASVGNEHGTVAAPQTSNLRTPGQAVFFRYRTGTTAAAATIAEGRRSRVYPQAYLYRGAFGLLAEYTDNRHTVRRDTEVGAFHHRGWQVAASMLLTGERASYRSVTPRKAFDLAAGTLGAVELAARVQSASVDAAAFPTFADPAVSARRARAWGVGVNWHLARNLKLMLDVERATFTGGAATGDRPAETFVATRFQFAY